MTTLEAAVRCAALAALGIVAVLGGGCQSTTKTLSEANAGARIAASSATELGTPRAYIPTGRIVADSGFRPQRDGFSFENYPIGNQASYQDLTPAQLVNLFGPRVCDSRQGSGCILTAPAQDWMTITNQTMQNGHCFGMSVTSLLMFQNVLEPLNYGGPSPPTLLLFGNVALQQRIAQSFALQYSDKVRRAFIRGKPNEVLDVLIKRLKNPAETYTLGMFKREGGGGHAVTPYAVEDKGDGKFAVLIYDNNYPRITRAVMFDRTEDTWSYEAAPHSVLDGDATTNWPTLIPTTPGIGVQPCAFCGERRGTPTESPARVVPPSMNAEAYEEVSLIADAVNHSHLLITDSDGRMTGFVNGKLVNQIPEARVMTPWLTQNFNLAPEPRYQIPRNVQYTISLDGSGLSAPDTESVSVIGPGYSAVASDLTMLPGQRDRLRVTGNGTSLHYRAGPRHTQSPHLEIGLERTGPDYRFAVTAPRINAGSALTTVARPAGKRLILDASDVKNSARYSLTIAQQRKAGTPTVRGRTIQVPSGGSAQLRFAGR